MRVFDALKTDWLGRGENYVKRAELTFDLLTLEPYSTFMYKIPAGAVSFVQPLTTKFVSTIKPVTIKYSDKGSSTDGKQIIISTEPEATLEPQKALDVMIGLGCREVAHIMYTTFEVEKNEVLRAIINIVEDERIEDRMVTDLPGVFPFLQRAKAFFFDRIPDAPKNELQEIFLAFLRLVRYPATLPEELADKYNDVLEQILEILTPYPSTFEEVKIASKKIYELFLQFMDEQEEQQQRNEQGESEDVEEGEGQSSGEESTEEKMLRMLKSLAQALEPEVEGEKPEDTRILPTEGTCDVFSVRWQKPGGMIKGKPDLSSVAAIRREFLPIDYTKKHVLHNKNSGSLDDTELVRGFAGSKNIYEVTSYGKADILNLVLLVDQSGSMDGSRIEMARNVAIIVREATRGFSFIRFFAYGHSTEDSGRPTPTDLDIFCEKGVDKLDSIQAKNACNRDGSAIMEVTARVQALSPYKTVILMISDGQPNALVPHGFTDESFIRHAVKFAEKRKTKIAHISMVGLSWKNVYAYEMDASSNFTMKMVLMLRQVLKDNFAQNVLTKL